MFLVWPYWTILGCFPPVMPAIGGELGQKGPDPSEFLVRMVIPTPRAHFSATKTLSGSGNGVDR